MSGRSRHGLHVVRDDEAPPAEEITAVPRPPRGRPFVTFQQQIVVLKIAGTLNADTAGRLRMFLSMFTVEGGPRELLLDLSEVVAVDEDGLAPVLEADELLGLRRASLRLTSVSAAVSHYLDGVRGDRTLTTGSPPGVASPGPVGGPAASALDDRPRRGQD
jgi:anti-anti-sigma factor